MAIMRAFASVALDSARAVVVTVGTVAPTGAAAGGIGAFTVDRHFRFKRAATAYKDLDPLALASMQAAHCDVPPLMAGEISMWGQNIYGRYRQRPGLIRFRGPKAARPCPRSALFRACWCIRPQALWQECVRRSRHGLYTRPTCSPST
jgi:hypothetical protein